MAFMSRLNGIYIKRNIWVIFFKKSFVFRLVNVKKIPFFQYYLTPENVGKNRAQASLKHLIELNSYVAVHAHTENLSEEFLKKFKVCLGGFWKTKFSFCHNMHMYLVLMQEKVI